jgi:DNA-binding SARP family transcriptional activator
VVAVRLFGALSVEIDGVRLGPRDFGGVKPKQVLEVLLVRRGRAVHKQEIAELVWGESPPHNVEATLETYVSVLRARLGSARGLISTEPAGYRFDAEGASFDVDEFDRLLRRAAGAPAEERRERLGAALALAGGELLADEPYGLWALDLRAVYAERRVQATCDLAETCLALADFGGALVGCEEAPLLDPVLERAHRVAILAHYGAGEEERALRAYERCRAALLEALGTTPTPETAATHAAILRREDPWTLIASAAASSELPAAPPGSTATRYAHNGEVGLAYQTLGDGPLDIVFVPGFISHVEAAWEDPTYASFMRRLARDARLVIFDKRGTGLSDAVVEWPTLAQRVDDMTAVMDAAGSERAVVFGVSEGGPMGRVPQLL